LHLTKASSSQKLIHDINKKINDAEMSNFKMFFVSALVDIETVHKESQKIRILNMNLLWIHIYHLRHKCLNLL